jgi:cell division protein FtsI (penicillin-binding protein 3)
MDFEGEGRPVIPQPSDKTGLIFAPWMAFGYGVSVTPMQTLAFYNAVANNGTGKTTICVRNKRVEQTIVKMEKKSLTHRYVQPKHY